MKLQEILDLGIDGKYIPIEQIEARKKQINAYFKGYYKCEAVVIVWNVTNSGGATTICPVNEIYDCIDQVLENYYSYLSENEREEQRELINFNSYILK